MTIAQFIIELFANPSNEEISLRMKEEDLVLHLAAQTGYSQIVKFLISKGVDKMEENKEGHTALSLAVRENHLNVVKVFFEEWMDPNYIKAPFKMHLSPIFNVKSHEMVQFLIDQDTQTHEIFNEKSQSPLFIACQKGLLEVVQFFILNDGFDINHLDNDQKNPLFYALENMHFHIAHFLFRNGAKLSFEGIKSYHIKPLSKLYNVSSLKLFQTLLENHFDEKNMNEKGQTPLHVACQLGLLKLVRLFLFDRNLFLNMKDKDKRTPLFYAHQNDHHKIVKILIKHGAVCGCDYTHVSYYPLAFVYICRQSKDLFVTLISY